LTDEDRAPLKTFIDYLTMMERNAEGEKSSP